MPARYLGQEQGHIPIILNTYYKINNRTKYSVAGQQCKGNRFLSFHGSTEPFHIPESYIYTSDIKQKKMRDHENNSYANVQERKVV